MGVAYQLENFAYSYGGPPVLSVDSLAMSEGAVIALVGPNGAGKTTLLHALAFLRMDYEGAIFFFGERGGRENALRFRRRIGLLLQNPYLFNTSVLANLVWGLRIRKISRKTSRELALAALDRVGLAGFEKRHARSLSGGEGQRVALARALVLDPDVLLLDEPGNHMDRESVQRTEEIMLQLNREHGKTIIFTTHNLGQAEALAHRILHIVQGTLFPASAENLFRGVVQEDGSFDTGRIRVQLTAPPRTGTCMTIDASAIQLTDSKSSTPETTTLAGTIVGLRAENGRIRVEVDAGERFQVVVNNEGGTIPDLQLGATVHLTIRPDAVHVF